MLGDLVRNVWYWYRVRRLKAQLVKVKIQLHAMAVPVETSLFDLEPFWKLQKQKLVIELKLEALEGTD